MILNEENFEEFYNAQQAVEVGLGYDPTVDNRIAINNVLKRQRAKGGLPPTEESTLAKLLPPSSAAGASFSYNDGLAVYLTRRGEVR